MTVGRLTKISKPSLLISSTTTATCIAPRALTLKSAEPSISSSLIEILVLASLSNRSRISREVTRSPSLPAIGPSLTEKDIITVGGSISTKGRSSTSGSLERVSPISTSSKPDKPIIFPATPSTESLVDNAEYSKIFDTFDLSGEESDRKRQTGSPTFALPEITFPTAIRPT